jgi:hypothetical protein
MDQDFWSHGSGLLEFWSKSRADRDLMAALLEGSASEIMSVSNRSLAAFVLNLGVA